jgi:hypothetical protein
MMDHEMFRGLLAETLRNPPDETTTRAELAPYRSEIVASLEKKVSRRFLYTLFTRTGGQICYQRFCALLRDILADEQLVRDIKSNERNVRPASKLVEERRSGRIGKSLEEIQRDTTAALVRVAGFREE